ncbi:MAG: hypothetical protein WA151_22970 [Desulfatirhabdiaceae bacterium]
MILIIIRGFNSVNSGFSVGGKAWENTGSLLQCRFADGRVESGRLDRMALW